MIEKLFMYVEEAEKALVEGEVEKAKVYVMLAEVVCSIGQMRGPAAREMMMRGQGGNVPT